MDLFKLQFNGVWLENGQSIEGYESVSWVERYTTPGEFKITARLSSGLREFLPLGTIISHIQTLEMMWVENHEITEDKDVDPEVIITGRSFETVLSNRVVGGNQDWGFYDSYFTDEGYVLNAATLHSQIETLIEDHAGYGVINTTDALPFTFAFSNVTAGAPIEEQRVIKKGDLHTRTVELLALRDYGLRTIRPNTFGGEFEGYTSIMFMIHDGNDKQETVIFSSQTGDIENAKHLWSNKKFKNAALVSGKFVEQPVYGSQTGYDRRMMWIDASDIDDYLTDPPVEPVLTYIRDLMGARGRQVLANQRLLTLSSVNVTDNRAYRFRTDFDIGDIVSLDTHFGETLAMRIVEYAEIEDENGESGYPTLSVLDI